METSIFVAKIVAVLYIATGLGMIINTKYFKKAMKEMYKSHVAAFLGGIMALAVGVVLVSVHNVWVMEWPVLITLIGWAALLKGVFLFLAPKQMLKNSKFVIDKMQLIGFGALIFGLVMGYFGFLA